MRQFVRNQAPAALTMRLIAAAAEDQVAAAGGGLDAARHLVGRVHAHRGEIGLERRLHGVPDARFEWTSTIRRH